MILSKFPNLAPNTLNKITQVYSIISSAYQCKKLTSQFSFKTVYLISHSCQYDDGWLGQNMLLSWYDTE